MADQDQIDDREYAVVTMRYNGAELGFAMRPEVMDQGLTSAVQKLRECILTYSPADAHLYQLEKIGDAK